MKLTSPHFLRLKFLCLFISAVAGLVVGSYVRHVQAVQTFCYTTGHLSTLYPRYPEWQTINVINRQISVLVKEMP